MKPDEVYRSTLKTFIRAHKKHIFFDTTACQNISVDPPYTNCMLRFHSYTGYHVMKCSCPHPSKTCVLQAAETHRCACPHPGILWPTQAAFCPLVPTTMSHTISSCQISLVTLGQVPTHIVPLSVSRHRQLLGRVTPCCSGLQASIVARELVVLSGKIAVFGCFFFFAQLDP